jgi:hypothetical protein
MNGFMDDKFMEHLAHVALYILAASFIADIIKFGLTFTAIGLVFVIAIVVISSIIHISMGGELPKEEK